MSHNAMNANAASANCAIHASMGAGNGARFYSFVQLV